jgi:hypothetical protein
VSEAAAAEVDADPDPAVLVSEDVDVVIAAADGAELLAGLVAEVAPHAHRQRLPGRRLEQRVINRRIVRSVLAPDAERQHVLDLVGDGLQAIGEPRGPGQRQVGANRRVAARDVEAHADHRDLFVVAGDAADRHDVTQVAVGHDRQAVGAAGHGSSCFMVCGSFAEHDVLVDAVFMAAFLMHVMSTRATLRALRLFLHCDTDETPNHIGVGLSDSRPWVRKHRPAQRHHRSN